MDILANIDLDLLSYWELVDIILELGYLSILKLYYKLPNKEVKIGLVLIVDD